jgi:hypothetical protein
MKNDGKMSVKLGLETDSVVDTDNLKLNSGKK